jgi:hypothetical protein
MVFGLSCFCGRPKKNPLPAALLKELAFPEVVRIVKLVPTKELSIFHSWRREPPSVRDLA